MNHCLLEVEVIQPPTVRYTQDNQTPIAEMEVRFAGLRADDPPTQLKVVGWGNIAQELKSIVSVGQRLLLEGRLRMNTVPRKDGTKEKRAEFTLGKFHPIGQASNPKGENSTAPSPSISQVDSASDQKIPVEPESLNWNSSPLIPDTDEIPF